MAIVEMKKMRVVALSNEKERIMDTLKKVKCFEIKTPDEIEGTHTRLNEGRVDKTEGKLNKISFAIDFILSQRAERVKYAAKGIVSYEPPKKKNFFEVRDDVSFDEFISSQNGEYELLAVIDELEKQNDRLLAIKSEKVRIANSVSLLSPFARLSVPLSEIKDTRNVCFFLGTVQQSSLAILKKLEEFELAGFEILEQSAVNTSVVVYAHKSVKADVSEIMTEAGFVKYNGEFKGNAGDGLQKLNEEAKALDDEIVEINGKVVSQEKSLDDLKCLYDYYNFKLKKILAQGNFRRTERESVVVFEGWVPSPDTEFIGKQLEEVTDRIYYEFSEPKAGDNPPTLTKNNKIVSPFEGVTNMYSAPSYFENDPNPIVSIFFFIFFGFMLSDAGYGLLLALGGFLLLKFTKMEKGMKKLVTVIALCGISTVIWGLLFGGFFSIEIEGTFLEKLCWVTPLDSPLAVMGLSLALGLIQILCGLGMKAKQLIDDGQPWDAVFDIGPWYLLFIGVIILVLSLLVESAQGLKNIGLYIMAAGGVALVLTQGRAEKSIFKKLFKGVASLYGIVNYVSDLLSYSRLFGLGLATGVVGMVFNRIAGVFIDILGPFAGGIIAVVFILAGHALNIAINTLGAYVHNCRLQYIEFFSRFYTGGGHIFAPFGDDTKYVNVI